MFSRIGIIILFSLAIIGEVVAQDKFWNDLKFRRAFESETSDDEKPAIISMTFPTKSESQNHYLINAGIGYKINDTFTGFFAFNKNNQIEKEQHNYKFGLTADRIFDFEERNAWLFSNSTIEYLQNYRDTTHSGVITSYLHPFYKKGLIKLGGYSQRNHVVACYFSPKAGAEYQQSFKANSEEKKGHDFRAYYGVGFSLLFKKKSIVKIEEEKEQKLIKTDSVFTSELKGMKRNEKSEEGKPTKKLLPKNRWKKGVEFKMSYEGRSSLLYSLEGIETYNPLYKAEVIFYPAPTQDFSIGFSYNNGADPIEGIEKQEFYLISLQFKK